MDCDPLRRERETERERKGDRGGGRERGRGRMRGRGRGADETGEKEGRAAEFPQLHTHKVHICAWRSGRCQCDS